jgi:hypothetical protein
VSIYDNDPRVTPRRGFRTAVHAGREFDLVQVREPTGGLHPSLVEAFDAVTGDRVHGVGHLDDVLRALIGDPQ